MWNPVPDTWLQATKSGFFATWPRITLEIVINNYQSSPETEKYHMCTDFKNARSTKRYKMNISTKNKKQVREHECSMKIIDLSHKIYSDQTSRFSIKSSKVNKHFIKIHYHDSNVIISIVLKTKSASE